MTIAWMLYILGVGTLLAVGAGLLASAVRHFGHSIRFVHAAALATMLVLAALTAFGSFAAWAWRYVPMYVRPRVDGR